MSVFSLISKGKKGCRRVLEAGETINVLTGTWHPFTAGHVLCSECYEKDTGRWKHFPFTLTQEFVGKLRKVGLQLQCGDTINRGTSWEPEMI